MSAIQVVGAQAYLAGLSVVHESVECLTHLAQVRHPAYGTRNCYLKYYFQDRGSKGLANEVCGHVLAEAVGLSVPENPLILTLPPNLLAQMHSRHAANIPAGADVAVWAVEQVRGQILPAGAEQAALLLRRWTQLPELIAFDTWVQNADRYPGNLIRRRNSSIVLIDHGHLAGSVRWAADLLQPDADPRHPFLSLWEGTIPDSINQGIMEAAGKHAACYRRAESDLQHWLGFLLGEGDRMALLDFLRKRADGSQDRMSRILGLLL